MLSVHNSSVWNCVAVLYRCWRYIKRTEFSHSFSLKLCSACSRRRTQSGAMLVNRVESAGKAEPKEASTNNCLINWPTRHVGAGDGEDLGIFGCCLSVFLQQSLPTRSHRFQTPRHRFPQSGRSVQSLSEEHSGMIWVCLGCQHAWGALEVLIWVTPGTVSTALNLPLQRCTFATSSHPSPVSDLTKGVFTISSSFSGGLIRLYSLAKAWHLVPRRNTELTSVYCTA